MSAEDTARRADRPAPGRSRGRHPVITIVICAESQRIANLYRGSCELAGILDQSAEPWRISALRGRVGTASPGRGGASATASATRALRCGAATVSTRTSSGSASNGAPCSASGRAARPARISRAALALAQQQLDVGARGLSPAGRGRSRAPPRRWCRVGCRLVRRGRASGPARQLALAVERHLAGRQRMRHPPRLLATLKT